MVKIGSVRPGLTFCPIFLPVQNNRPLAGFESGKGAMRSRSVRSMVKELSPQVDLPAISSPSLRAPAP